MIHNKCLDLAIENLSKYNNKIFAKGKNNI